MATELTSSQKKAWSTKVIVAFVVLALLCSAFPAPAQAAPPVKCAEKYYVVAGDTLNKVANLYGLDWQAIIDANNLSEPYNLLIGQRLCIPKADKSNQVKNNKYKAGNAKPISFYWTRTGSELTVTTGSFPKNNSFFVKVDDFTLAGILWYKLGVLRIKKDGSMKETYSLPKDLRKAAQLTVCLKNIYTDAIACKTGYIASK
jgi:murein DD-endopeptidase MepM/ murein hydrolase activator NlpD